MEPTHVSFAKSDEVLIVGFNDSSVAVYDSGQLFSAANARVEPLFQLPNASGQGPIIQLLNNPGDLPNLVLILREAMNPNGASVEVLDVSQRAVISGWKGNATDSTTPTAGMYFALLLTARTSHHPFSFLVSKREATRHWNAKRGYPYIPAI